MPSEENIIRLLSLLNESYGNSTLIKLTLSNKRLKASDLNNVFIRPVVIREQAVLQFIYRYATRDITSNYPAGEAAGEIEELLKETFMNADLFTAEADYTLLSNKKGNSRLLKKAASSAELPLYRHDKLKRRLITTENNVYLRELGVLTNDWKVKAGMEDKFRQINRYVELVDDVLKKAGLPEPFSIADMGSGKGYLTFALYDHLSRNSGASFSITGVELRQALVDTCNNIAKKAGFDHLHFITGSIAEAGLTEPNVLIALHACDTATDEAIYRGITSGAEVIMVAPCCHKQIRKQINPPNVLKEITRYGIFEERQAETLTDTIRALILEAWGYKTSVAEFISTEHTPKNVMLSGLRKKVRTSPDPAVVKKISELKQQFGIQYHELERLLNKK
ncbi:MAG: SAM-dependent methyltransferase [Lentimicrobium sp.]|uniref:class I SAM-dependent methyltransferase n=4 Tax=Lentimicrobium sp. TaxID=2034841 RepID=UPI0025D5DCCB|nr:SAM-dependent methyltransferase [Lentimicrobium sp.]MCO5256029.1 SAM-dependent methyltransferase [Lentimicrobium sp.]